MYCDKNWEVRKWCLKKESPTWRRREEGSGTGAYLRQSVLRSLKEVIYKLGSDERDTVSQAKIWGKIRAQQQHKYVVQSRFWLKQNEEQNRIQEILNRGSQEEPSGPGYGVLVLLCLLFRSYMIISICFRLMQTSIRHIGRTAYEKKHMGLDGVLL